MRKLGSLFAYVALATLLAQAIGLSHLIVSGQLTRDNLARIIAILYGIELTGRAESADTKNEAAGVAQTLEERIEAQGLKLREIELREQGLQQRKNELEVQQRKLMADVELYRAAKAEFEKELAEWQTGQKAAALESAAQLLGNLRSKQAKEQVLLMLKQNEMPWVVSLFKALPAAKRAKLAGEFTSPDEARLLAEVLKQIREGQPEIALADQARKQLEPPAQPPGSSPAP
jgi:hypothetical protein